MRTAESICFLCKKEKATKLNSHIFPKFLSKSILGNKNAKRGYIISTNGTELTQDTDKEDHMLCPLCEQYFSVLETYISSRLYNRLWDIRRSPEFTIHQNEGGICWKVCEEINPIIVRLFIYSIIWRCSITSTPVCNDFKLDEMEEEILRTLLNACNSDTQTNLLTNQSKFDSSGHQIPFLFFTSESFADRTGNMLFANPATKNPYQIALNEYMLIFSFRNNETQEKFNFLNNIDNEKIKVGFFKEDFWKNIRDQLIGQVTDSLKAKIKETGQNPLQIRLRK